MKKKVIVIGGAILLLGVLGAGAGLRNGGDDLLEVETAQVERQKIVQTVNASGRIQPRTQVKISADVSALRVSLDRSR